MDWIKLSTGLFTDEKIQLLRSEKNGDELINIWLQLLCLAGKQDNDGVFMLTETRAYTPAQLAAITGRDQKRFIAAIDLYESLGMIIVDNGCVSITNWGKHQGESVTRDAYKKSNQERQKRYRERQRNVTRNVTEGKTLRYVTDTEKEEEEEKEKELLQPVVVVGERNARNERNAAKRVMDVWPNLPQTAIEQLISYMEDLPDEVIIWALEETQLKPGAGFKYMKSILDRCLEQGLKTVDAIKQASADHKAYKNSQASTGSKTGNAAKVDLNYQMHKYTESDFDDLYLDPAKYFEGSNSR